MGTNSIIRFARQLEALCLFLCVSLFLFQRYNDNHCSSNHRSRCHFAAAIDFSVHHHHHSSDHLSRLRAGSVSTSAVRTMRGMDVRLSFTAGSKIHTLLTQLESQHNDSSSSMETGLKNVYLCLMLDSMICDCFPDDLSNLVVSIPEHCVLDSRPHYFSLMAIYTIPQDSDAPEGKWESEIEIAPPIKVDTTASDDAMTTEQLSSSISHALDYPKVTLVLAVTVDDVGRCAVLLETIVLVSQRYQQERRSKSVPTDIISELIVVVPSPQLQLMASILTGYAQRLFFPIRVVAEHVIFDVTEHEFRSWIASGLPTYAVQMAIKLLVAKMVQTDFYLTLDADLLLTNPFEMLQHMIVPVLPLASHGDNYNQRWRALYDHESRYLNHPHWWTGSEATAGIDVSFGGKMNGHYSRDYNEFRQPNQGFSVTPALLSTFGSLVVTGHLLSWQHEGIGQLPKALGERNRHQVLSIVRGASFDGKDSATLERLKKDRLLKWLSSFTGDHPQIWSEYSLYRVVLDYYQVFDKLHFSQQSIANEYMLHCNNVWYADQAELWRPNKGRLNYKNGEANIASDGPRVSTISDSGDRSKCLFSVFQSTVNIRPSNIFTTYTEEFEL